MRKRYGLCIALYTPLYLLAANGYLAIRLNGRWAWAVLAAVLVTNVLSGKTVFRTENRKLLRCFRGVVMLSVFGITAFVSIPVQLMILGHLGGIWQKVLSILLCVAVEGVLFWNGIACVYLNSVQLGIRHRVWGAICGMIPIANLYMLAKIIRTVLSEVEVESEKEQRNLSRREQAVCGTKYPVVLVHGVFFRDSRQFNYWGRIPGELERNGARVFYGEHPSALSVADSAAVLAKRIRKIAEETGCEKVNLIAHSKGGLDCRYAICKLDAAPYVASLTTVNTPHRGCLFADHLLTKIPASVQEQVAAAYNTALAAIGDENPNFLGAVEDLTAAACVSRDKELVTPEGIFTQSIGSVLTDAGSGQFPLNLTYGLVERFDGTNDGLVGEDSFAFGQHYTLIETDGKRGISHGDMIDLNRENIEGFDVREFFVQLVSDLKARGL